LLILKFRVVLFLEIFQVSDEWGEGYTVVAMYLHSLFSMQLNVRPFQFVHIRPISVVRQYRACSMFWYLYRNVNEMGGACSPDGGWESCVQGFGGET
jgi:hypothetical protein